MKREMKQEDQGAPPARLVIDRSKWLVGRPHESRLRNKSSGEMCCLGFYGLTCGFTNEEIERSRTPHPSRSDERWPDWLFDRERRNTSTDCGNLMGDNDSLILSEEQREASIRDVFAQHGVTVEFVGDALQAPEKIP